MKIDLNCDVGEGLNNEHLLMPLTSSCNIACGGHAGSVEIIDRVMELAIKNKVKTGAHPSFPDRINFGRKVMGISNNQLQQSLEEQMQLFKERAIFHHTQVHHIKPHGALYNLVVVNREKAEVVCKAIRNVFEKIKIYAPYRSKVEEVAQEYEIEVVYEAFADRNYNDDLTLVSRSDPHAVLTDPGAIITHVSGMLNKSKVKTISGKELMIKAQTFCVHGDNENAIAILKALHQYLDM
ncbi:MAG: 5-oxoprolinase subunit PxpA [Flavobacteriaceae bacterium]|nr:MAG: 5-oxoprolinase subunit PxpA [Flavobacteriaceae bacterium]